MSDDSVNVLVRHVCLGVNADSVQSRVPKLVGHPKVNVHQESDFESLEGPGRVIARPEKVARVSIDKKLSDEAGLGQNVIIVGESGDHPIGIDGEIFWCARGGDIHEAGLE